MALQFSGREGLGVTFSIIVPTCGRPTLKRALDSAVGQLRAGDRVLVVGDGRQTDAERTCADYTRSVRYLEGPQTSCFGNRQRQLGMLRAWADYLLFLDDDDVFTPGALATVRDAIRLWPGRPMLFKFIDRNGLVLWLRPEVLQGNVSTAQIVFPNRAEWLGEWGDRYEGDYDFIRSTLDKWPGGENAVVWRPNILTDCRKAVAA